MPGAVHSLAKGEAPGRPRWVLAGSSNQQLSASTASLCKPFISHLLHLRYFSLPGRPRPRGCLVPPWRRSWDRVRLDGTYRSGQKWYLSSCLVHSEPQPHTISKAEGIFCLYWLYCGLLCLSLAAEFESEHLGEVSV